VNHEKKNAKSMEMLAPSGAAAQSQLDIAIANVGQAEAEVSARNRHRSWQAQSGICQHPRADQRAALARITERRAGPSKHADACCHPSAR
jgi:hypothetical protein